MEIIWSSIKNFRKKKFYLQIVCCWDNIHCCPKGYTCDLERHACVRPESPSPMRNVLPQQFISHKEVQSVTCPDHKSQCPDGATCCMMATGQYGCCPMPNVSLITSPILQQEHVTLPHQFDLYKKAQYIYFYYITEYILSSFLVQLT